MLIDKKNVKEITGKLTITSLKLYLNFTSCKYNAISKMKDHDVSTFHKNGYKYELCDLMNAELYKIYHVRNSSRVGVWKNAVYKYMPLVDDFCSTPLYSGNPLVKDIWEHFPKLSIKILDGKKFILPIDVVYFADKEIGTDFKNKGIDLKALEKTRLHILNQSKFLIHKKDCADIDLPHPLINIITNPSAPDNVILNELREFVKTSNIHVNDVLDILLTEFSCVKTMSSKDTKGVKLLIEELFYK